MLGIFSRDAMKKKKSIHLRALMAKMITAMYSLLGKNEFIRVTNRSVDHQWFFGHGGNQNAYTNCR